MGDLRDCGGCVAYEEMLDLVAQALGKELWLLVGVKEEEQTATSTPGATSTAKRATLGPSPGPRRPKRVADCWGQTYQNLPIASQTD